MANNNEQNGKAFSAYSNENSSVNNNLILGLIVYG